MIHSLYQNGVKVHLQHHKISIRIKNGRDLSVSPVRFYNN